MDNDLIGLVPTGCLHYTMPDKMVDKTCVRSFFFYLFYNIKLAAKSYQYFVVILNKMIILYWILVEMITANYILLGYLHEPYLTIQWVLLA